MALSVKTYLRCDASDDHKWEIRRFFVPAGIAVSYAYIKEKLESVIYPALKQKDFILHWKDDEGDLITVSSDEELMTALTCRKDEMLRLFIKIKSPASASNQSGNGNSSSSSQSDGKDKHTAEEVHPLVNCDGCEKGIYGFRYKCLECPDYDLCRACESCKIHPQHFMIRMPRPVDASGGFGAFMPCMFGRQGFGGRGHGRGPRRMPTFGAFGHRRHHGHRSSSDEKESEECRNQSGAAGCEGSDQPHMGSPPVFPFHQVLHKIWTVLGGLPREDGSEQAAGGGGYTPNGSPTAGTAPGNGTQNPFNNEEFLKTVGETVAAVLDPLGINVEVDVEHKNGQRQHCGGVFTGKGQKCGFATPPPQPPQQQQQHEQQETAKSPERDVPIPMPMPMKPAEPAVVVAEPPVAENLAEKDESVAEVAEKRSATPPAPTTVYNGETGDWTYIGDKEKALIPPSAASVDGSTPTGNGAKPKVVTDMKQAVRHPNPAVREGLQQMLAMGFTNEGGWLTQLLEVKGGDIHSVLDVLTPVNKNMN